MAKHYTALISLIVFLLSIRLNYGQTQQLGYTPIIGTNEVSLGKINAITQDKFGFMWFSDQSNGSIIRYDGSYMKSYRHDRENPNSLGGSYPECLFADSTGIIWIGFWGQGGQGIDRFDPLNNTFTHYRHDDNDPDSLISDVVSAILVDHLGNVWVGTDKGLDLLDQKTGKFRHFKNIPGDSTSLSHNYVRSIYEDREGTLWVGTGFAYDDDNLGGLNRLDLKTGTFTRFMYDPKNPNSLIDNKVRTIFEDSRGNFWIGTRGDGLHTLDRKTGVITRHSYNPTKPNQLSRPPLNPNVPSDHITFITEDVEKKIWIGTSASGINIYDPETNKTTNLLDNADLMETSGINTGWCAYPTNNGLVWLSTELNNKLYKIDLYNNSIPLNIDDGQVYSFFEETPTILWMGTATGLLKRDTKDGTSQRLTHNSQNPNSLVNNIVYKIIKDRDGIFWFGTLNGLSSYNPMSQKFTNYLNNPKDSTSLSHDFVTDILEDNQSNLWISTWGGGLERLDRTTGRFTHYKNNPADQTSLSTDAINCLIQDKNNTLWIGGGLNNGISRFNQKTGTFDRFLIGLSVTSFCIDAEGVLWAGCGTGLYRYDKTSDSFIAQDINIFVVSIVTDDDNNLWTYTSTGIVKWDPSREHRVTYGRQNGVIGTKNMLGGMINRQNGEILVGNPSGYYAIYPNRLKSFTDTLKVYFTDFKINGELVFPVDNSLLKESIFNTKEIKLTHNQNVFSLSFTAIDYRTLGDNKISYKLENYDSDWHITSADDPVDYYKVPPGNYVMYIKAENSTNGMWSEKSIAIIISPPWWATWWAYFIYSLLFVIGVYFVHSYQKARVIRAERERSRAKELAQAKEIEKAYHHLEESHNTLKATQSQLIQSEKMASLGELTAGIAHEIQNPLNFVNNFSEVSEELLEEMMEELKKGNIKEVETLAKDIIENLEKVAHHGKRADSIVKGMLQHSRTSTGIKEPTNINLLAEEYLRLAYHGLRAKDKSFNATMKTDFDQSIGKIEVIPQDIGRVVLNLITNAFYAVTEKKNRLKNEVPKKSFEPTVLVSTKKLDSTVEIRVKDNGNGIPEKLIDKIFQPFFSTKPTGQGTGLGLSLSYDIVTTHGGEIKVKSEEGKGTEFIIQLPANKKSK